MHLRRELHAQTHIATSSQPFHTRADVHVCESLSSVQAFTDGCEKFAQPDVGEQLIEALAHDTLAEHPQLELAGGPGRTNALRLTFRVLDTIFGLYCPQGLR
jgi:hypothetical protein